MSAVKIEGGRLILPDGILSAPLYFEGGKITAIGGDRPHDTVIDAGGAYVCPGFIDMHVHGGGGARFEDGTEEAILQAVNIHAHHGTTTIFPTVSSRDAGTTALALKAVRDYGGGALANIGGVHLEGPYFSPKQAGAQDPSQIRYPDPKEYVPLIAEYGDLIKRWSYAPELDPDHTFLDYLNDHGIMSAAGHTDAVFSEIKAAHEKGMNLITHLYSCTSTITREGGFRILGVIESAYYFRNMDVEIIADGCHLPPELIELVVRGKGVEHTALITDAIRFGGVENAGNTVDDDSVPYIIEDGVAKLLDRSAFAGSIATMDRLIRVCVEKAGIPLVDAVRMASETPARIMGLAKKGKLEAGADADLVLLGEDLTVEKVFVGGTCIGDPKSEKENV